ncbi:MAG: VCBS repeat-containing protein, partial [Candidatus Levybacteria bacterium]|nr:VCBS repeat-containing protein [Candidatus Levybacteria bacterium]
MKITVFFLLAFFIFISSSFAQEDASPPSSSTDTSTEKFTNTGFETDTSSWTTAATLTRDTSIKYRGTASAKIVNSGASALDLTQSVNVGNTNSYFLSAYAFLDPYALGSSFDGTRVDYSTGSNPRGVAIGDLNGDGKADLVVISNHSASVFINNGNGTFATKVDYSFSEYLRDIAIGDLNGDGKPDLAVALGGAYTPFSVLINNGNGTFASAINYSIGWGYDIGSIAIGDVDGDSKSDIVLGTLSGNRQYYQDRVFFAINNGNGTFTVEGNNRNMGSIQSKTGDIAIGDLNGDGKPDLAAAGYGRNTVSVFINNGNGTSPINYSLPLGNNTPSEYYNFATKVDYSTFGPNHLAIGDLNGDGKPDLAVANSYGSISVLINNGNGTFAARVDYSTIQYSENIAIGDLNGDGKPDIAVTNSSSNTVSLFTNNGNGTFAARIDYATGSNPRGVAIGDLNGDGKADLAVPNYSSNTVSIFNSITLSVDANLVELSYNGSSIPTTYTPVTGGWYKLSATVTGINGSTAYGVQVKAGRSIYVDDFSLTDNSPSKKLKECSTSDNNDNIAVNTAGSGLICEMNIKKKILNELASGTAKNN